MDETQSKWLVALSALLALLVLGVVFLEPPDATRDTDRRWTGIAEGRTVDEVSAVILKLDGETVRIEREDGAWKWVTPVAVPAVGTAMDALVRSVLDLQAGETIDVQPASVGITPDSPTVTLETGGSTPLVLRIGDDAPIGSASYIQLGDGPIQASRTRILGALPHQLQDLREPSLVSFPRSDVNRISMQLEAGAPIVFERDLLGWWRTDEAPRIRASESTIHTLVDTIRFSKASSFIDTEPPLTQGTMSVTVHWGDPPQESTITVQPMSPSGWRASGPNHPGQVVLATDDLPSILAGTPTNWVETRLVGLRPTLLERVHVSLDGVELTTMRTEDGWTDARTDALLTALETGEALRGAEIPGPEGSPTGRIDVQHGSTVASFTVYQPADGGGRITAETGTDARLVVSATTIDALTNALRQ